MSHEHDPATEHHLLRHYLATLAYRTQKAVRGAPEGFGDYRAAKGVRTPHELVWHMTGVLGYARTFLLGGVWRPEKETSFDDEIHRFHELLEDLSRLIESEMPTPEISATQLLQGPLSDAMTHAGQIIMLRRLSGSPVPPENFVMAKIDAANLGPDQSPPAAPDDVWNEPDEDA